MDALPLLRQKQPPISSSIEPNRPRVPSEELVVPEIERVSSVYYGVDAFSPTLVDLCTAEQRRLIWSSRAHRKMMTTLYNACHGRSFWRVYSLSYWASICSIFANLFFVAGCFEEFVMTQRSDLDASAITSVNICFLTGALFYLVWHILNYFEVINSCHNLEIWLEEYFYGYEPILRRQCFGFFLSRIDFWAEFLGIIGSLLLVVARIFLLSLSGDENNYGIVHVGREKIVIILGYWIPFFVGSFLLLIGSYLSYVEVIHQWFSCCLTTVEGLVTALNMISTSGFLISSTLQLMDPFSAIFGFAACIIPFVGGSLIGLISGILSIAEVEHLHRKENHPEYGILKKQKGYGTWS